MDKNIEVTITNGNGEIFAHLNLDEMVGGDFERFAEIVMTELIAKARNGKRAGRNVEAIIEWIKL